MGNVKELTLAEKSEKLRRKTGLSRKNLGKLVGTTSREILKIERGCKTTEEVADAIDWYYRLTHKKIQTRKLDNAEL